MQAVRANIDYDWDRVAPLTCYDLSMVLLDGVDQRYTGTARVTFTNPLDEPLTDLVFRTYANSDVIFGGSLKITTAEIDGVAVEPQVLLPDGTAYRLPLPDKLQPENIVTVVLQFEGELPQDFGSARTYGTFNLSRQEPVIAMASWYPILAVLDGSEWQVSPVHPTGDVVVSEIAFYHVVIDAPHDWQIATTGILASSAAHEFRITHEFISGPVRDFMVIASPAFDTEEIQHGDIRLVHWRLPDITYDSSVLTTAAQSLDLLTDRFGPYPYTELDIVDIPLQNASGVEYPGLVILATNLYTDPDRRSFLQTVVLHEVAHQWWYAVVGNDVNRHPWQDEGLATFSALLYHEKYDPAYYQGSIEFYRQQVSRYEQENGQQPIGQPVSAFNNTDSGYAIVVYYKGALFFVDLRTEIGDEAFFSALSSYFAISKFRIASPNVLLNAFERACRCDLSGFYRSYGALFP
jgi:aminopeptidase N